MTGVSTVGTAKRPAARNAPDFALVVPADEAGEAGLASEPVSPAMKGRLPRLA